LTRNLDDRPAPGAGAGSVAGDTSTAVTEPFIDAHHHLWKLDALYYPWLTDRPVPRRFGDYRAIRRDYLVGDLLVECAGCGLVKSVHVQANVHGDPVRESAWLQEQHDVHGFPHAIVGAVDLTAPDAARTLAAHREFACMRGVRVLLHWLDDPRYDGPLRPHLMGDPAFRRGYALLEEFDLSFDLPLHHPQVDEAVELLSSFPRIPVVLNHCGFPVHLERAGAERTEAWIGWKQAITRLAELENLHCKLSGLWMAGLRLGFDDVRPIVDHCLESFGPERCMFGSNFPLDGLWIGYAEMYETYVRCLEQLSPDERAAVLHDNAAAFYKI
jgi:predicted TIM-barrel fold metal-dependent hydrolase